MKPDEVCEKYSNKKVGLSIKLMDPEDHGEEPTMVLIEGSSDALGMLAELLTAVATEQKVDGFSISPFGAGRIHFAKKSKLGVYIHKLDR